MNRSMRRAVLLCLCLQGGFFLYAGEPEGKRWKESTEVSFVNANGNTKATSVSSKNFFSYEDGGMKWELEAGALGARSRRVTTAEQYFASEKGAWKFTPRSYLYEKERWDRDRFAGIRDRHDLSAGYGHQVLDGRRDKLAAELGLGYVSEDRTAGTRNDFSSGRAYAKYGRVLSPTADFSQDFEYLANFEDPDGYRLNAETALTASISTHTSMKTSFRWKHVNDPPAGFAKNDTLTSAALLFNF